MLPSDLINAGYDIVLDPVIESRFRKLLDGLYTKIRRRRPFVIFVICRIQIECVTIQSRITAMPDTSDARTVARTAHTKPSILTTIFYPITRIYGSRLGKCNS